MTLLWSNVRCRDVLFCDAVVEYWPVRYCAVAVERSPVPCGVVVFSNGKAGQGGVQ